jgi:hypothetical protein
VLLLTTVVNGRGIRRARVIRAAGSRLVAAVVRAVTSRHCVLEDVRGLEPGHISELKALTRIGRSRCATLLHRSADSIAGEEKCGGADHERFDEHLDGVEIE